MKSFLMRLNTRYDSLGNVGRMAVMLMLAVPAIVLVHGGAALRNWWVTLFGFLWLLFIMSARMVGLSARRRKP